jgi:hypothetical protein
VYRTASTSRELVHSAGVRLRQSAASSTVPVSVAHREYFLNAFVKLRSAQYYPGYIPSTLCGFELVVFADKRRAISYSCAASDLCTEAMPMSIYCHWEQERFPDSDFYVDEQGRRVHRTTTRHTTEGAALKLPGQTPPPTVSNTRAMADSVDPPGDLDAVIWPALPYVELDDPQAEVKKILYEAQVQNVLTRQQLTIDTKKIQDERHADVKKAARANDYAQQQGLYAAYVDIAKGAIVRSQCRAQYVETAAAAISTAYVAILAVTFKADGTSTGSHYLPAQSMVPTFFLGLSIALSAVYLAYIRKSPPLPGPVAGASLSENEANQREAFITWSSAVVMSRAFFLHRAVISLAMGVILLPVAFAKLTLCAVAFIVGVAVLIGFLLPTLIRRLSRISWKLRWRSLIRVVRKRGNKQATTP